MKNSRLICPIASVVIPTYNRAMDLRRCLVSLTLQSNKDFEVIVCDDGSTDNTSDVVQEFGKHLSIKYLKLENFGGPARPRNRGIKQARGKYIAFLDSDDWWCPEKVAVSITTLEKGYDVVYHDLYLIDGRNPKFMTKPKVLKARDLKKPVFDDLLFNGNAVNLSSVVVRRDKIVSIDGFSEDKSLIAGEDYEAWLRLAKVTNRFKRIKKAMGFYWAGGGNISDAYRTIEFTSAIKTLYKTELSKGSAFISYQLARAYMDCGDLGEAQKNILEVLSLTSSAKLFAKALATIFQIQLKKYNII